LTRVLLVALGGALGSVARYGMTVASPRLFGLGFPWGTFLVNVTGSFLIAIVVELAVNGALVSPEARLFLATGVLGGFTTYSSFNQETLALAVDGRWGSAGLYLAGTVVTCLIAGVLGLVAGRALLPG
jgi:CrcB protein